MSVFNLKSSGPKIDDAMIVSDLDALIAKPVAFVFQGRTHLIKTMSTEVFFKTVEGIARLDRLKDKDYSKEDLVNGYLNIFSSVCDTIGRKEVEEMTQAQAMALFQLILDSVTGKAQVGEEKTNAEENNEKKKTELISMPHSSAPNFVARLVGAFRMFWRCLRGNSSSWSRPHDG